MELTTNGNVHVPESPTEVTLSPTELRKLARLHARAEGAAQVAQAAIVAAQAAQETLQQALTETCEDAGMEVPQGQNAPVSVDWRTGVVKLQQSPTGPVPQPAPVPPPIPLTVPAE